MSLKIAFAAVLFATSLAAAPADWNRTVAYEIFVRSFQDSNGDGIGDLNGIIRRLDYLKGLGIGAVWLTPIFKSPSYHGYDASDYRQINPDYGDLAGFQNLLREAHQRGIRVLLDMAVNHTSTEHPWFKESASDERSPFRDFYLWKPAPADWKDQGKPVGHWTKSGREFYFSFFSKNLPDLNWNNSQVFERISETFVYWAQQGVDGFRLDAARYLIKGNSGAPDQADTHRIWKNIVARVRTVKPDAYFIGEVWADAKVIDTYYGQGDELDAAFSFPFSFGLQDSLKRNSVSPLEKSLKEILTLRVPSFAAPILTNHDMDRLATVVKGDDRKLKVAALALLTLPGTPYLYYGEELGLPNGKSGGGDLPKRPLMPWATVAEEAGDPASVLNTYKNLIALRGRVPELQDGELKDIQKHGKAVLSYRRVGKERESVIVLNLGSRKSEPVRFSASGKPQVLYPEVGLKVSRAGADWKIGPLPPVSGAVIRLSK